MKTKTGVKDDDEEKMYKKKFSRRGKNPLGFIVSSCFIV